jgi:maleylacetoacetate isomerase
MSIRLYSYWRSSAAYRVRIALALKGIPYDIVPVSLAPGAAEHRQDEYRELNPQMLVPYLEDGEVGVAQSLAILEYLEETYTDKPLLPESPADSAAVRSFCSAICCDIHPLNNLRVLQYLQQELGVSHEQRDAWYAHWILEGLPSAELVAADSTGPFVFGEQPTLADACLIPQLYNARRFKVPLDDFPNLVAVEKHCNALPAFIAALPENQPDCA